MKKLLNYILSIFDPKWKDGRLDFLIKSILGLIIWMFLTFITLLIIFEINILLNKWNYQVWIFISLLPMLVGIIFIWWIQTIVTIRRLRDLWINTWVVVLYLISIIFWIWIFFWIYLCLAKWKDNSKWVKN